MIFSYNQILETKHSHRVLEGLMLRTTIIFVVLSTSWVSRGDEQVFNKRKTAIVSDDLCKHIFPLLCVRDHLLQLVSMAKHINRTVLAIEQQVCFPPCPEEENLSGYMLLRL